jgi:peptide deformylase
MPKILDIITHPNPILRQNSKPIDINSFEEKKWQQLCKDMTLTMLKRDGVGLAAPQIGRNLRLIVINTADGPLCLINPVLKRKSLRREWGEEGCLSLPNIFGQVKRHKKVVCNYFDWQKKKKTIVAHGLLARIIQHEIDHLDGILFIDKAKNIKKIKQ